jgi:uncharacterized protein
MWHSVKQMKVIRSQKSVTRESRLAENAESSQFRVARSRTGLGLFAVAPIRAGQFIIEYWGKRISSEKADGLGTKYLFDLNGRWVIDGSDRRNTARYINHACKPNSVARVERGAIRIRAKKNINPGDEITYHYGKAYFEAILSIKGCRCATCAAPAKSETSQPARVPKLRDA